MTRFSELKKPFAFFLALTMAFGGQPLLSPVLADGYYDENWNWIEETNSYDPWITDTDGDGILDWEELNGFYVEREVTDQMTYSYPVYNPDTGEETWEIGTYSYTATSSVWVTTSPESADTDQDGLPDGWERNSGYHPQDATDGRADNDADGLTNGVEYVLGTLMWLADSDGDGFGDALEVYALLTDPLNPDDPAVDPDSGNTNGGSGEGSGEGDGVGGDPGGTGAPEPYTHENSPSPDLDTDGDGISDYEEASGYEIDSLTYGTRVTATTDPINPDSDGDGLSDGWERSNGMDPTDPNDAWYDVDGDGLSAWDEYQRGTDIRNPDTDGDGSMDGASVDVPEPYNSGNTVEPESYDPRNNPSPDIDSDGDGLSDWEEYHFSTDPENPDTDGDGFMDNAEIDGGSDPRDPESTLNNVRRPPIIDTGDGPEERAGIRITTVDLETSKVHLEADDLTSPTTVHVSMRPKDGSGAEQSIGSTVIPALGQVEVPFDGLPALETTFIARYHYEGEERESEYDVLLSVGIEPDSNMVGVIGDIVKSAQAGSTLKHFVTPKKSTELNQDHVVLKATGITAEQITPGHANQVVEWDGGEEVPNEPLKRRVKRDATGSGPTEVKIKVKQGGSVAAKMHVWVVWATLSARYKASDGDELHEENELTFDSISAEKFGPHELYELLELGPVKYFQRLFLNGIEWRSEISPKAIFAENADIPDLKKLWQKDEKKLSDDGRCYHSHWDNTRDRISKVYYDGVEVHEESDSDWVPDDSQNYDTDGNPYDGKRTGGGVPTGSIFSVDTPGIVTTTKIDETTVTETPDGVTDYKLKQIFREYSRILIGEKWYVISTKRNWHSNTSAEKGSDGVWRYNESGENNIDEGHL